MCRRSLSNQSHTLFVIRFFFYIGLYILYADNCIYGDIIEKQEDNTCS